VKPERENGLRLIAQHLFRMRQDNRRCAVNAVVYSAQQDRMRNGDVEQLRVLAVGFFLLGVAQFLRRPAAEQMQYLTLRTHAPDVRGIGLERAEVDQ
jgi:hypothetical protein